MSLKSVILPVLAIAGHVAAQCPSGNPTFTIQNQGDAGRFQGCRTYTGNVAIATEVTSEIRLDGVESIDGDLIADNVVGLPSLSASSLSSITGAFRLINMTLLTSLSMPRLEQVGSIEWQTLPRLSALGFTSGVSQASSVSISDSQLGSLNGIALDTVDTMLISNNNQLNNISMPLENIATSFNVEFNGRQMNIQLPQLTNAFNMTFRNVSQVSMPGLQSVNGSLGFYGNMFESLAAPNLTEVGGSISFVSNTRLTNVSMPRLATIRGALQVANNTEYANIDGFQAVTQVGGAVDCYGNFTDVALPNLDNVAGAFNLQSSENIQQTCSRYEPLRGRDNVIKGEFTCVGETSNPGGVGSTPTDGSTSTQSGAAARELYARSASVGGVIGVFAALLGML